MVNPKLSNSAFLKNSNDPTNTKPIIIKSESDMITILNKYTTELIAAINKSMGNTINTEKLIGLDQMLDIQQIDNELDRIEQRLGSDLMGIIAGTINNAYKRGVGTAQQQIDRIQGYPTIPHISPKDQQTIQLLQNVNFGLVRTLSAHHVQIAKDLFVDGMSNGLGQKQIIDNIMQAVGGTEYQIRRIVRTETTRTANIGQKKRFQSSGIKYIQWNTASDERVCPICNQLHGKVIDIDSSFTPYLTGKAQRENKGKTIKLPPAHPNCRCGISPAFRKVFKPVTKPPKADKVAVKTDGFGPVERIKFKQMLGLIPSQVRNKVDLLNGKNEITKVKGAIADNKEFQSLVTQDVANLYRDATGVYIGGKVQRIFLSKHTGFDEILHEVGHAIYDQFLTTGTRNKTNFDKIWVFQKDLGKIPTARSAIGSDEFFSDVFRFYYMRHDWLQQEYPEAYNFIKDNIFYGNTLETKVSMEIILDITVQPLIFCDSCFKQIDVLKQYYIIVGKTLLNACCKECRDKILNVVGGL